MPGKIYETITSLLEARLQPLVAGKEKSLNLVSCVEIYTTIFEALVEVVTQTQLDLTNEGVNYLAQQLYDGVLVNGRYELDPDIFSQRAKLEEIETRELTILATVLAGTDFARPLILEIKKRS